MAREDFKCYVARTGSIYELGLPPKMLIFRELARKLPYECNCFQETAHLDGM